MGDNREHSVNSREFGVVATDEIDRPRLAPLLAPGLPRPAPGADLSGSAASARDTGTLRQGGVWPLAGATRLKPAAQPPLGWLSAPRNAADGTG